MSALTERVANEHRYSPAYGGCACGLSYEGDASTYCGEWHLHAEHVAEVTEAAVRANVAAEIQRRLNAADLIRLADAYSGYYQGVRAGYQDALEVAEGRTND